MQTRIPFQVSSFSDVGIQLEDKVSYHLFRKDYTSTNYSRVLRLILNKTFIISKFMNIVTETHNQPLPANGSHLISIETRESITYHRHRFLG